MIKNTEIGNVHREWDKQPQAGTGAVAVLFYKKNRYAGLPREGKISGEAPGDTTSRQHLRIKGLEGDKTPISRLRRLMVRF